MLASVGGKAHVVEYSEISTEMAEATREEASRRSTVDGTSLTADGTTSTPSLRFPAKGAIRLGHAAALRRRAHLRQLLLRGIPPKAIALK